MSSPLVFFFILSHFSHADVVPTVSTKKADRRIGLSKSLGTSLLQHATFGHQELASRNLVARLSANSVGISTLASSPTTTTTSISSSILQCPSPENVPSLGKLTMPPDKEYHLVMLCILQPGYHDKPVLKDCTPTEDCLRELQNYFDECQVDQVDQDELKEKFRESHMDTCQRWAQRGPPLLASSVAATVAGYGMSSLGMAKSSSSMASSSVR